MPFETYYKRFDVAERDADGVLTPFASQTLSIYKVSDDTLVDTTTTDANGQVEGEGIGVDDLTQVYFKHASYSEKFYQTTQLTEDLAYTENKSNTFVLNDLFTDEETDVVVDIYLEDLSDGEVQIIKVAENVPPDSSVKIPYLTDETKDLKLYAVSKVRDSGEYANPYLDRTENDSLSLSSFAETTSGGTSNPYSGSWDGSLRFATEDDIYDKIESILPTLDIVRVDDANDTLEIWHQYIQENNSTQRDFALPATASQDSIFEVFAEGSGGVKITQAAGQKIHLSGGSTTTGTGGYLEISQYSFIRLKTIVADTEFVVISSTGSPTAT